MLTATEQDEYLAEIRQQVCSVCVERPPGGPPCAALGKMCGVEHHLPELIEAIRDVHSIAIAPYHESVQQQICENCAFHHSSSCPCPMDYLLVLIAEAVETVDARHERHRLGRQRLADVGGTGKTGLEVIRSIYDESAGTWTGCDWTTKFGKLGLDLNGWTSGQARKMASAAIPAEAAEWKAAANWLKTIEHHAETAEENAAWAVRAAIGDNWIDALEFARRAWASEFATGRMLWRGFPMTWQRLFLAVEAAVPDHPNALVAPLPQGEGMG